MIGTRQLRRPLAGLAVDRPGRDRPAPAAALHQPRLQRRGGARDHLHDRAADHGGPHQRPVSPWRARHVLDRGRPRRHRAVAALRALADPDRPGLRRRALLLAADVPGTGDGLSHLRSPRPRLEPVRHRRRRRSTTTSSAPTASGTCRSSRSCSATRPASRSRTTARWWSIERPRDATRSQYWMLAVMVAFTSLGLWLLSAAAQ